MTELWKVAILGMGFIGGNHAEAVLRSELAELSAVIETNEEAGKGAARQYGCAHYATLDEALSKERIDALIICLPTHLHEAHAIWAAERKLHVLCEKPFALSLASARNMFEAADRNGVRMMAAQAARWTPELMEVKRILKEGVLGDIRIGVTKRLGQHPNWSSWHRDPKKSGGALYDL
ncbi:MAG: Gfo/Idh/MocA family oxidoreductase, partial [Clostridia bacterium]|nr:Gfo/Idh/MocA family oxidoreductase [Clostridia bacterium]